MKSRNNRRNIIVNLISLCIVFIIMAVAALEHSGSVLGHKFSDGAKVTDIETRNDTVRINTTEICADVRGYVGPVPVEILIVNDTVAGVVALKNNETPRFFGRMINGKILDSWTGESVEKAIAKEVDAVSGATYSSNAVITNVRQGLSTYTPTKTGFKAITELMEPSTIAALIVLIAAMIIPLFWKNKKYRVVQQLLNVSVLGFWSGTFINYTMLLQAVETGTIALLITILLFITVFIYPLFGKKDYYCAWVCPLGSLQELASKCNPKHKLKFSDRVIKALTAFRKVLWGALMVSLLTGVWMSWIDYELFTAFAINVAPTGVIIAGATFILLSLFVPRPYCRFVCPTGTLIKLAQDVTKR